MSDVDSRRVPRLLVSVRSRAEARAALAGGCDILDVKEPRRGPLGMAELPVIASIVHVARQPAARRRAAPGDITRGQSVPEDGAPENGAPESGVLCSVACGEAVDVLQPGHDSERTGHDPEGGGRDSEPAARVDLFKLGPAGLGVECGWQRRWRQAWQHAARPLTDAIGQSAVTAHSPVTAHGPSVSGPSAVAVVYADWKQAGAPPPGAILDAVAACLAERSAADPGAPQFVGVLIDTFDKSSGRLLDFLRVDELENFASRLRAVRVPPEYRAGYAAEQRGGLPVNDTATFLDGGTRLFLALAGRLRSSDLIRLTSIRPDVIAVRSAVCSRHDRQSTVGADATRQFLEEMRQCFDDSDAPRLISAESGP